MKRAKIEALRLDTGMLRTIDRLAERNCRTREAEIVELLSYALHTWDGQDPRYFDRFPRAPDNPYVVLRPHPNPEPPLPASYWRGVLRRLRRRKDPSVASTIRTIEMCVSQAEAREKLCAKIAVKART